MSTALVGTPAPNRSPKLGVSLEARLAEAQRDRDAEVKHGDMSGFRRGLPNLGDAANLPRPPDGD
jgi:hypothetical protein